MDYFTIRDQSSGSAIKIGAEKTQQDTDTLVYNAVHNIQKAHPDSRVFGTANTTDTSDHSLIAASGDATLRTYVCSVQVVNTGPVGCLVTFKNGNAGSALAYACAPASYGSPCNIVFDPPIQTSLNTAVYFASDNTDTGGNVYVSAQGYTAA